MKLFLVFITYLNSIPVIEPFAFIPDKNACEISASSLNEKHSRKKRKNKGYFFCLNIPEPEKNKDE